MKPGTPSNFERWLSCTPGGQELAANFREKTDIYRRDSKVTPRLLRSGKTKIVIEHTVYRYNEVCATWTKLDECEVSYSSI